MNVKQYKSISTHILKSLLIFIFILMATPCFAAKWFEYESLHFKVISDKKRKESAQELIALEKFRQAAFIVTGIEKVEEKERLKIFVLSKKNYKKIFPHAGAAGFYIDSFLGSYMVIGPASETEDTAITLRHEYVHHLLHSQTHRHIPKWYDEGLADLLSTAIIKESGVTIGKPHPWRQPSISQGRLISFTDLLIPGNFLQDSSYSSAYYATAWLATHYFILGTLNGVDLSGVNLNRYLDAFNNGHHSPFEFEKLIGRTVKSLNKELKVYGSIRQKSGINIPVKINKQDIKTRRLSKNEHLFELASIALALGDTATAEALTSRAKKGRPNYGKALALHLYLKSLNDTAPLAQQLSEAIPLIDSPEASAFIAAALLATLKDGNKTIEQAKQLALTVTVNQPHNLYAYQTLWQAAELQGNSIDSLKYMQTAYELAPSNIALNLLLGEKLLLSTSPEQALPHLTKVVTWAHSAQQAQKAAELLQQLQKEN